jgi:hypothetical protein
MACGAAALAATRLMSHLSVRFRLLEKGGTLMDPKTVVFLLVLALMPGLLAAQTLPGGYSAASARDTRRAKGTLEGTAGLTSRGDSVQSASVGFSPAPRITLLLQGERVHVPTRYRTFVDGSSISRGFTALVLGGEVRVGVPAPGRISAYVALGIGAGGWGSNVDQYSSRRDSGPVVAANAGVGVRIRMRRNLSVVADARLALLVAGESAFGYVPIRGGLAWDL